MSSVVRSAGLPIAAAVGQSELPQFHRPPDSGQFCQIPVPLRGPGLVLLDREWEHWDPALVPSDPELGRLDPALAPSDLVD